LIFITDTTLDIFKHNTIELLMKFFNIDCHISVIYDIQHIFQALGHVVDDWCISGHHRIVGKELADITLCDGSKLGPCCIIDQEMCNKFYLTFKDELDKYDGFIACYPVANAMLYEQWGKPIIVMNCVRYEHPFTDKPDIWDGLNKFLKRYDQRGLLHYITNNKGDKYYTEYHTDIKPLWIPNLCAYTDTTYTGVDNPRILINNRTFLIDVRMAVLNARLHPVTYQQLNGPGKPYSWTAVANCKGIVHIPYHNGSMTIFENYTSCIPMFIPSKTLCKALFKHGYMFQDLTFYKIKNMAEPEDTNNPNHLSNPDVFQIWLDTTDFYDPENMPHITYFDSFHDLAAKLVHADYAGISQKMKEHNVIRKQRIYTSWNDILDSLK
jgi:hypothetical protein